MLFRFSRPIFWALLLSLVAVWGLPAAQADVQYTFDDFNKTGSGIYGTVSITDVNSTTFNFDVKIAGGTTNDFGFNNDGVAVSSISNIASNSAYTFSASGSSGFDGFGTAMHTISSSSMDKSTSELTFTVTTAAATTDADFNVLTTNPPGNIAAYMVAEYAPTVGQTGWIGATSGPSPNGGGGSVPEPTSLAIWGVFGLAGLAYKRRKMRTA